MKKIFTFIKRMFMFVLILCLVVVAFALGINFYVKGYSKDKIISVEQAAGLKDVDCILVLGAAVKNGNTPSAMLSDRLDKGIELYFAGVSPKMLMSGDHGGIYYDEVNVMKNYAKERGVPSSDIFMDHAGFSTYESMYRAKEIYQAKKVVIVTQEYHLPRALYIANKLGLEAYGVEAASITYSGQTKRDIREILARDKDFIMTIIKPEPSLLGNEIPISGDGDITNDK